MSVRACFEDREKIFGKVFLPLIEMKRDDIIQEFLFVSKIHRYEKLWLREIRKLSKKPEEYRGYDEALEIIPTFGERKRAIRAHLRENLHIHHLKAAIRRENQIDKGISK